MKSRILAQLPKRTPLTALESDDATLEALEYSIESCRSDMRALTLLMEKIQSPLTPPSVVAKVSLEHQVIADRHGDLTFDSSLESATPAGLLSKLKATFIKVVEKFRTAWRKFAYSASKVFKSYRGEVESSNKLVDNYNKRIGKLPDEFAISPLVYTKEAYAPLVAWNVENLSVDAAKRLSEANELHQSKLVDYLTTVVAANNRVINGIQNLILLTQSSDVVERISDEVSNSLSDLERVFSSPLSFDVNAGSLPADASMLGETDADLIVFPISHFKKQIAGKHRRQIVEAYISPIVNHSKGYDRAIQQRVNDYNNHEVMMTKQQLLDLTKTCQMHIANYDLIEDKLDELEQIMDRYSDPGYHLFTTTTKDQNGNTTVVNNYDDLLQDASRYNENLETVLNFVDHVYQLYHEVYYHLVKRHRMQISGILAAVEQNLSIHKL